MTIGSNWTKKFKQAVQSVTNPPVSSHLDYINLQIHRRKQAAKLIKFTGSAIITACFFYPIITLPLLILGDLN